MATKVPYVLEGDNQAIIYMSGIRPALEVARSFAFVLNISEIEGSSISLIAGHKIRRATNAEIIAIKDVLTNNAAETSWGAWQNGKVIVSGSKKTWARIPAMEWRYFVIEFRGDNSTVTQLERALSVAECELKIAFTVLRDVFPGHKHPALIYNPARLFSQVRRMTSETLSAVKISRSVAHSVRQLHSRIIAGTTSPLNPRGFVDQVLALDALPHDSPLLFLGYFAILESLLTHEVRKTDTIDSITRQVRQKVLLLDNRWSPRLDYGPFQDNKPVRVWSAMYAYRSCLAHGRTPDFLNELKILGDCDRALHLLTQTVKGVLRQVFVEPQLLLDLRDC